MTKKTLFINDDSNERIDLGDGFWVEVPEAISYSRAEKIFGGVDRSKVSEMEFGKKMIVSLIVKWNLTDEKGEIAEVSEENIGKLPMEIINIISNNLQSKMIFDKKKMPTSNEQSEETN